MIFDELSELQLAFRSFSPTSACALCPGKRYNEACGGCVS